MFQKVDVNGDNAHPLFKFLTKKAPGFLPAFLTASSKMAEYSRVPVSQNPQNSPAIPPVFRNRLKPNPTQI
jgi:glutathione peroxidase-family protein